MAADDVHLLGMGRADLGAVDLFARTRRRRLRVELAQLRVGLRIGSVLTPVRDADAARRGRRPAPVRRARGRPAAAAAAPPRRGVVRRRVVLVLDALGGCSRSS